MNSTVYIAAFIIISLVLFGILISWYNKRKKRRDTDKLIQDFDDFAIKNNLAIDKKQTLNKNMIGIDRMNFKLVFLDNNKTPQEFHLIDLLDLSNCRLIKHKNQNNGHISNISLQCIFKEKKEQDIILPFYNEMSDDLFKMLRLSKKASYWEKSINIFRESAILLTQRA
ncbi:MAG: hypothetical protein ABI237_16775 [Ginsengibacter sp.]